MKFKHVTFAAKGKVEIRESKIRDRLKPAEILIQTACTMISPGTEIAALLGQHSKSNSPNPPAWLRFPSIPGYLLSGKVVRTGSKVKKYPVGARIVAEGPGVWSSHVSHLILDQNNDKLVPIPHGVSFEEAVFTKMGSVSMTANRILRPQLGESTAVLGLGIVGQIAVQLFVLAGAKKVFAIDPLKSRRHIAELCPFVESLNPNQAAEKYGPIAGDRLSGLDNVIEASGHPAAFLQACQLARVRGKVAVLSSPHKAMELRLYDHIHSKGLQILGGHGFCLPSTPDINDRWSNREQLLFFLELIKDGRIKVNRLISHIIPYIKAPDIYKGLQKDAGRCLGVVFCWNGYRPKRR